jgi:hypothetical protein
MEKKMVWIAFNKNGTSGFSIHRTIEAALQHNKTEVKPYWEYWNGSYWSYTKMSITENE